MEAHRLLLCVLLLIVGVSCRNYASTYTTYPGRYYSSYLPAFKVPDANAVSKVRLFPITNSYPYDSGVVAFQICYAPKNTDGSWNLGQEVCSPWTSNVYTSYAVSKLLTLASDEYISTAFIQYNPYWNIPARVIFTTNTGRNVISGIDGYGTNWVNGPTYNFTTTFNNADRIFAGFQAADLGGVGFYSSVTWFSGDGGAVCGDGIVQPGEQCDSRSPCCTSTCQFATASTVCRNSAGLCDVAESCTGSSDVCPQDSYLAKGTRCGEFFGMCDVLLEQSCSGTSAQCYPTPTLPFSPLSTIADWASFNVISFDTFTCNGGDVEGRLAVKNRATLSGFDLGLKINTSTDGSFLSSLFVAGDASWTDGTLRPDYAVAYIGGSLSAPAYLTSRWSNDSSSSYASAFDAAQTYYSTIQTELASLPTNANAELIYGDGLRITCNNLTDVYHLKVDAATFSVVNWYNTVNCRFNARWIIDITGNGNVNFQGQPFPGIVERVIYNVVGTGRTITANNGVAGHILAPKNTYSQSQGVTYGQVVVGNVVQVRQNNKPNCINFKSVPVTNKLMRPVQLGDSIIYVAELTNWIIGDRVCINGDCQVIVSGDYQQVGGQVVGAVKMAGNYQTNAAEGDFATVMVDDAASVDRDTPLATMPPGTSFSFDSDATVLVASVLPVIALAVM